MTCVYKLTLFIMLKISCLQGQEHVDSKDYTNFIFDHKINYT